jgi:hypothetical protein
MPTDSAKHTKNAKHGKHGKHGTHGTHAKHGKHGKHAKSVSKKKGKGKDKKRKLEIIINHCDRMEDEIEEMKGKIEALEEKVAKKRRTQDPEKPLALWLVTTTMFVPHFNPEIKGGTNMSTAVSKSPWWQTHKGRIETWFKEEGLDKVAGSPGKATLISFIEENKIYDKMEAALPDIVQAIKDMKPIIKSEAAEEVEGSGSEGSGSEGSGSESSGSEGSGSDGSDSAESSEDEEDEEGEEDDSS